MAEVVEEVSAVTIRLTREEVTKIREALGRTTSEDLHGFFDRLEDKMMGR